MESNQQTPPNDARKRTLTIIVAACIMAVVLWFVVPIAFHSGQQSIQTPAQAAAGQ